MKYFHLIWTTFFSLSVLLSGCSKEEEKYEIFTPGTDVSVDEIQLVFKSSGKHSTVAFDIVFPNKKDVPVKINWGDDEKLYPYAKTNFSYTYPSSEKEYIITIQAPGITALNMDKEGGDQLTSILLGDCLSLHEFRFKQQDNILEVLDITRCPKIQTISLTISSPKFDLQGLKNLEKVNIMFTEGTAIHLDGMNWAEAELGFYEAQEIELSNCKKLETLAITGYAPVTKIKQFDKISLEGAMESLSLNQLYLKNTLDLTNLPTLTTLKGNNSDFENILFNKEITSVTLETNLGENTRLTTLDFTPCKSIEWISVLNYYYIQEVFLPDTETLRYVHITESFHIDEIYINKQ